MKLLSFFCLLFLQACGPTNGLQLISSRQFPSLPDMSAPESEPLGEVKWDIPRDSSGTVLNSNIFIGLSNDNWLVFQSNWNIIQAREAMWQARLLEINRQRAEWRRGNENAPINR